MKFHIIRTGESLKDILFLYNLSKDELVEENRHIRNWDKLIPGTKLKIPSITEEVEREVNDMEPFIEDYYPKLTSANLSGKETSFESNEEEVSLDINDSHTISNEEKVATDVTNQNEFVGNTQSADEIKTINVSNDKPAVKTAVYQPYVLGKYNYPRIQAYPYVYYPVYYKKRSK